MLILANINTLYDGTSANPKSLKHNIDVFIEAQKIQDVKTHDPNLFKNNNHKIIDCSKYTVTPGLIDCHAHITLLGFDEKDIEIMNSQAALLFIEKNLNKTLVEGGVTTLRDMGGATHLMKQLIEDGVMIGPRLKIAICLLSTTGGHGDFRGRDRCCGDLSPIWPPMPGRPSGIVDGPWECRKRVREIAACGADLIKICASPGVISPTDHLEHRDFTVKEMIAICDEAEARGLRVAAHAHSAKGIAMAIECGVYDIQHISFLDEELAEKAKAKGCVVTPTCWALQVLQETTGLSEFIQEKLHTVINHHSKAVKNALNAGLKILAGSDALVRNMHGKNYLELTYLMKDGVPTLEAWHGATGLAALEIGQTDTGTIEPHKRADLLICQGDVIEHPELIGQGGLIEVIKDGVGHKGLIKE